jgi:glycosyltransferase involved in cell wall biosynthesis
MHGNQGNIAASIARGAVPSTLQGVNHAFGSWLRRQRKVLWSRRMNRGLTMNRRIAFFVQDLRGGGAERNIVRIVNGIAARGVPTDLVLVSREGPYLSELDPRVNVIELPEKRTLTSIWGLRRYLRSANPAALVANLTHINVAACFARVLAGYRGKVIVVERNQYTRNRELKRGLVRLTYDAVPWAYRSADVIGTVSTGVKDDLAAATGLPKDRMQVLYNPVVTPELAALAAQEPDHPWMHDGGDPVILAVGRLTRQKNYPLLLEAFAQVRKARPARLLILGEGELRADLEAQVARLGLGESVSLPGFRANPFAFMSRAALFVMSSDWEGLPTVLIEAMACGAPVVATRCDSGPGEILEEGRYGRLTPMGDAPALAQAMIATLDDPGDKAQRIARAHHFNLDAAVDRYLAFAGLA